MNNLKDSTMVFPSLTNKNVIGLVIEKDQVRIFETKNEKDKNIINDYANSIKGDIVYDYINDYIILGIEYNDLKPLYSFTIKTTSIKDFDYYSSETPVLILKYHIEDNTNMEYVYLDSFKDYQEAEQFMKRILFKKNSNVVA